MVCNVLLRLPLLLQDHLKSDHTFKAIQMQSELHLFVCVWLLISLLSSRSGQWVQTAIAYIPQ